MSQGEEPLASLEEEDESAEDDSTQDEQEVAEADSEDDSDEPDVLLTEAGNVLIDALVLKEQRFAVHSPKEE